jgi:hypothetical protein
MHAAVLGTGASRDISRLVRVGLVQEGVGVCGEPLAVLEQEAVG